MTDFTPTDEEATRRERGFVGWDENGPAFAAPEPEIVSRLLMAADGPPWWPRANKVQLAPVDGGSILEGYGPKGLWHTTETSGWPSYSTNSFPHMTVGLTEGRFTARQHIPLNRAARALRNESGGVQTNRTGVKQVEIITRADIVDEIGLAPALEDGLADWAQWLKANWGVPLTCTVIFKPYPASYGKGNGVRLTGSAWERYAGWCGHQHAPENDHGDPGALDWRRILRPEEDDMDYETFKGFMDRYLTAVITRDDGSTETLPGLQGLTAFGQRSWKDTQRDLLPQLQEVNRRLAALEERLP